MCVFYCTEKFLTVCRACLLVGALSDVVQTFHRCGNCCEDFSMLQTQTFLHISTYSDAYMCSYDSFLCFLNDISLAGLYLYRRILCFVHWTVTYREGDVWLLYDPSCSSVGRHVNVQLTARLLTVQVLTAALCMLMVHYQMKCEATHYCASYWPRRMVM